ncbi:MAG TPA: hypothetical protein VLQ92_13610, partial [Candidatus Limnocylindrales bacterium]|nr:hypothetical protein [Candidatus Limnocylindrales bacterium]
MTQPGDGGSDGTPASLEPASDAAPEPAAPRVAASTPAAALLGPVEIRALAAQLDLRPTKTLGQNFVIDANTVRRIVR